MKEQTYKITPAKILVVKEITKEGELIYKEEPFDTFAIKKQQAIDKGK